MTGGNQFRREMLVDLATSSREVWDVIVIGGGATGLGAAVDAASRGYRTLLLEQFDFGKGTSSRSTKLAHGGVRYLPQGNLRLVFKSLRERGLLLQNAPHLASPIEFVVPCYKPWEKGYYGVGLKVYDLMAGRLGLNSTRLLSRDDVLTRLSGIVSKDLRGGVSYFDGQFDDARMCVNLAQTCADNGGVPLNYFGVTQFSRTNGKLDSVVALDAESGAEHRFTARSIVNATGVFADRIRQMDDPTQSSTIRTSQGIHLVLDRSFLPGSSALMVPRTDDGRVVFAIPWHGHVLLGTTETPVAEIEIEPRPREAEVDYLLEHAARYLAKSPSRSDILSVFAGLRPLVGANDGDTKSISRDHVLFVSKSGLVTITGGKWTTYRLMAEEAVDLAVKVGGLDPCPPVTASLNIHGAAGSPASSDHLAVFGTDCEFVKRLIATLPRGDERIHPRLPYRRGEVVWVVRSEMARTVEDVLARRTRALFLDAGASIEAAPDVAALVAQELNKDEAWIEEQIGQFSALARRYLISKTRRNALSVLADANSNTSRSFYSN